MVEYKAAVEAERAKTERPKEAAKRKSDLTPHMRLEEKTRRLASGRSLSFLEGNAETLRAPTTSNNGRTASPSCLNACPLDASVGPYGFFLLVRSGRIQFDNPEPI